MSLLSKKRVIGVDLFQPIIPSYRVALFEGLERDPELDISVQASSQTVGGDSSVEMDVASYCMNRKLFSFFGGRVIWQTGFEFIKAGAPGDVVVVCGDMHQLSSLWMAAKAKRRGFGVIWWGHHQSMNAKPFLVKLRLAVAKFVSDCFLCYTDQGIRMLARNGFNASTTFATGNTVDTELIRKLTLLWDTEKTQKFKESNGIQNKRILLFCGVLRQKSRMDVFFQALKIVCSKKNDVLLLVIGSGEKLQSCKGQVAELQLTENVRFLGEIRSQVDLAPWFMSSELFAYGGAIGLSIIHAMAYGLPVIVHGNANLHGPEFEAMHPGVNGLTFRHNDANDMAEKIISLLNDKEALKAMKKNALETVRRNYSIESMVARFKECIETASRISLAKRNKSV